VEQENPAVNGMGEASVFEWRQLVKAGDEEDAGPDPGTGRRRLVDGPAAGA
jgi:hypothetical protein